PPRHGDGWEQHPSTCAAAVGTGISTRGGAFTERRYVVVKSLRIRNAEVCRTATSKYNHAVSSIMFCSFLVYGSISTSTDPEPKTANMAWLQSPMTAAEHTAPLAPFVRLVGSAVVPKTGTSAIAPFT